VDGAARRQLDTVLVRWVIENTGRAAVPAGLRLQLDTLIGINDGVPFTVPGRTGLVSTMADFRQDKDIPDFIQALEVPNLKNPGTIAHLTLKPGGGIEAPGRVSLTHWPTHGVRFGGPGAWDVPMRNMFDDSCVVLYWPEKAIKPGEKRTIGFAYGLGNVTINDKLGITLGGQFEPGQNFTVSAYVENPVAGQTLKLELPDGLRRVEGDQMQNVALGGKTSIVTWKVLVERTGEFKLKVISSTGLSQAKTITIARGEAPTGGKLTLDLQGKFEPGETFNVIGKVTEPIANQTLTLHLPAGLEKTGGADMQTVPAPPAGSKDSIVQWQVRVKEPGKFPVRVSSSTGIAQTKTITIVQPGRSDGAFQIALDGPFEPGKAFTVSTKVRNPIPDQKLTLVLPEGLQRADGAETQTAQNDVLLSWKVKVEQPGKYTVGLKSTSGVTQRKTLVIEPPGDAGGRFDFKLEGEIRPSKEFKVVAEVTKPVAGQTLTLVLPKGLQLTGGDAKQTVAPGAVSKVNWSVRVTESGRLPVRIESSTGLTKAKTITLAEPNSSLFGR
jgi:predicted secreted protein